MLLCCFREPKKDKDELSSTEDRVTLRHVTPTRVTKHQQLTINNSQIILTTSELPSADCENVQIHAYQRCPSGSSRGDRHSVTSQTPSERSLRSTPRRKERYPPSKDEKRILKQRSSQELIAKSAYNLPYIDQSPDRRISDSQGKDVPNGILRSTPNLSRPPPASSTPSSQYPSPPSTSSNMSPISVNSNVQLVSTEAVIEDAEVQGRGMTRSTASYGIQQMLNQQILQEEKDQLSRRHEQEMRSALTQLTSSYEEKIKVLRQEQDAKLQQLIQSEQTKLANARNTFETESKTLIGSHESAIEALTKAHRAEVARLRESHEEECDKLNEGFEERLRAKEEEYKKVIADLQERDLAWQEEKQDVLSEIQRLKDEANRFIAILEEEHGSDENLSPGKRQTLQREVDSLQDAKLVVEMRTAEIHRLREERTRHLQQLEELEITKNTLQKLNAKVEDLQAQLKQKCVLERQLSHEKEQLESFYHEESKRKDRMSMQVEELQWRIKHNLELPPTQVYTVMRSSSPDFLDSSPEFIMNGSVSSPEDQPLRTPEFRTPDSRTPDDPLCDKILPPTMNGGDKMTHAQMEKLQRESQKIQDDLIQNENNDTEKITPTSSPVEAESRTSVPHEVDDNANIPDEIQLLAEENGNAPATEESDDDSIEKLGEPESLDQLTDDDEGLGDISSEDGGASPVHHQKEPESGAKDMILEHIVTSSVTSSVASSPTKSVTTPSDERMPSRIPFSLETNL